MTSGRERLRPLGTLAPAGRDELWSAARLDRTPEMSTDERARVITYLVGCPVSLAWMGQTSDGIGDRFHVAGGAAIASDGTFYWRMDAMEYIREYGIPIPRRATQHFEMMGWTPPTIDRPAYLRIYRELDGLLGGGDVVG